MNRYLIFSPIGRGTFGIVYKAYDLLLNKDVAIKQVAKNSESVSKEAEILEKLKNSKNCIKMLDLFYGFTTQLNEFIVFEYLPYTLKDFIYKNSDVRKNENFETKIKFVFREIVNGLRDLHELGIIHRDLKPENILVDDFVDPKVVKICDFGSAKWIKDDFLNPYVVSSYYRAPELLFAAREYCEAIDIWSAGCVLAEIYLKRPLFYCCFEGELFALQVKELGKPLKDVLEYFAKEAGVEYDQLNQAVDILMAKFLNAEKIVNVGKNGICRSVFKIIKNLLSWDFKNRPSACTILKYKFCQ